jgi:hypothetical protein
MRQSSDPTRRSQAMLVSQPAPRHQPRIMAMTGRGLCSIASRQKARGPFASICVWISAGTPAGRAERSRPAEKALSPAPRRITQRVSPAEASSSSAPASEASRLGERALRDSGRFRVSRATRSRISTSNSSPSAINPTSSGSFPVQQYLTSNMASGITASRD